MQTAVSGSTGSAFDWHDVRFIGAVAGKYTLADRRTEDGLPQVYACRLCSISTRQAVVVGPVSGVRGERFAAHFDEFGIVKGHILRQLDGAFGVELELDEAGRDKLGAKILWMKRRVHEQEPDKREHKRIPPREPRSTMVMADGTRMPCFVIDVSRSGMAVSADVYPSIGTPLAVGRLVGRVVRYLPVGFAIQFIVPLETDDFESLLTLPSCD